MHIHVLEFESIDSTNSEAIRQAVMGADEGLCVVARQQTAGRGRLGRSWVSEPDIGLYFSIVLRPRIDTRLLPLIPLAAGVAVYDTLVEFDIKADLKWVNDLLVDEKKIAGILAESVETVIGRAVVVGIGVNLLSTSYPGEINSVATSIEAITGVRLKTQDVTPVLIEKLDRYYEILENGRQDEIIEHWKDRSTYFSGKTVKVLLGNSSIEGITDGLESNGALRLRKADGSLEIVQAGDVQRLRSKEIEL